MKFKYMAPLLCGVALAGFAGQSFAQGPDPILVGPSSGWRGWARKPG
jgi:hypothetical protein